MEANSLRQQLHPNSSQVQERDQTKLVSLGPNLTLPGSACGQEVGQVVEHGYLLYNLVAEWQGGGFPKNWGVLAKNVVKALSTEGRASKQRCLVVSNKGFRSLY